MTYSIGRHRIRLDVAVQKAKSPCHQADEVVLNFNRATMKKTCKIDGSPLSDTGWGREGGQWDAGMTVAATLGLVCRESLSQDRLTQRSLFLSPLELQQEKIVA